MLFQPQQFVDVTFCLFYYYSIFLLQLHTKGFYLLIVFASFPINLFRVRCAGGDLLHISDTYWQRGGASPQKHSDMQLYGVTLYYKKRKKNQTVLASKSQ